MERMADAALSSRATRRRPVSVQQCDAGADPRRAQGRRRRSTSTRRSRTTSSTSSPRRASPKEAGLQRPRADSIEYGASPRASIALNLAARAHAFLRHRGYVTPEDVKAIGPDVLRHRIILTYEAEAEEVTQRADRPARLRAVEVP